MNVSSTTAAGATWQTFDSAQQPRQPALTNTAALLGLSTSDLSDALRSGTTLAQLAQQKGVSSSDLLSSVEKDLQANAPAGAPTPTSDQLQQFATDLINGTRHQHHHHQGFGAGGQGGAAASPLGAPSLANTASLLGLSSDDLSSALQSGATLGDLAQEKGVSSTDLLSSVEADLTANAPADAPTLSSTQLQQIATSMIDGTLPSSSGPAASSNLQSLASSAGIDPTVLLQQLSSGADLSELLSSPGAAGYGSTLGGSLDGGIAVDEYALVHVSASARCTRGCRGAQTPPRVRPVDQHGQCRRRRRSLNDGADGALPAHHVPHHRP